MIKKILLIALFIPVLLQAQKTIGGSFAPAEEYKWFIVYKLNPTHQKYIDNGKIEEGKMAYTFTEDAVPGVYRIVYGLPQETANFDFIYSGNEDIKFTFSEEGLEYSSSKENQLRTAYFSSINLVKKQINEFYQNGSTDTKKFNTIFNTLADTQTLFEKESEGTIVNHFIKANKPYIPEGYETPKEMVNNIKKHYFDAINFSDSILNNSDFITEKISNYVFTALPLKELTPQEKEVEYQNNIKTVAQNIIDSDAPYKKVIYNVLWEQMVETEHQETANFITDTYLMELTKTLSDPEMKEKLALYKRISFGAKAPDFSWKKDKEIKRLSELDEAENYILVFWSSTCSHCLKELPKLKEFVESKEEGKFKVVAVGLEDDEFSWSNEISFYPDFIHVLGLNKWENEIGDLYGITATPTFFVLDKEKRIIGKPDDLKTIVEFYNAAEK